MPDLAALSNLDGMRCELIRHPDFPCDAVDGIAVEVERPDRDRLVLRYAATGEIRRLVLPRPAAPDRTDDLWRRTCFEAFVRPLEGASYLEFNLSPSTQWAAYRFEGYRYRSEPASVRPPRIEMNKGSDRVELTAALDLSPELPQHAAWRVGLSAVIEETDGRLSYWALAHPPGRPEFHPADCFAAELPAPDRP